MTIRRKCTSCIAFLTTYEYRDTLPFLSFLVTLSLEYHSTDVVKEHQVCTYIFRATGILHQYQYTSCAATGEPSTDYCPSRMLFLLFRSTFKPHKPLKEAASHVRIRLMKEIMDSKNEEDCEHGILVYTCPPSHPSTGFWGKPYLSTPLFPGHIKSPQPNETNIVNLERATGRSTREVHHQRLRTGVTAISKRIGPSFGFER